MGLKHEPSDDIPKWGRIYKMAITDPMTVEQYRAAQKPVPAGTVIIDSHAAIESLSVEELGDLVENGVTALDAADNVLSLRVDQAEMLGTLSVSSDDQLTLRDSRSILEGLTESRVTYLIEKGIDSIDAGDTNHLSFSEDLIFKFINANVAFDESDSVTIISSSKLGATFTPQEIALLSDKGIDVISDGDSSPNVSRSIGANHAKALAASKLRYDFSDSTRIYDDGSDIAMLSASELSKLGNKGIRFLDSWDNQLTLSFDQFQALSASSANRIGLGEEDNVTLKASLSNLAALDGAAIEDLSARGVDTLFLVDSGNALSALSEQKLAELHAKGVDIIDAGNDAIAFSLGQYNALGTIKLTASDVITLAVSAAEMNGFTSEQVNAAKARGVDTLSLKDAGGAIGALTIAQLSSIGSKGISVLDATDDKLSLSVDQYNVLGAVRLSTSDAVTLSDTGGKLATLTSAQVASLSAGGIDELDASNNSYTLSSAQYNALGSVKLSDSDVVTIAADGDTALSHGGNHLTLTGGAMRGTGNSLANTVSGNVKNNVLEGLEGNDSLYGGLGKDQLSGGSGKDTFVFDTRPHKSRNVDKVLDFKSKDDSFQLDNKYFAKLGSGTSKGKKLKSDMFTEGNKAKDAEDRIIYDKKTGALYYDQDGTGSKAQVKIATISNKTKLYWHDFFVI